MEFEIKKATRNDLDVIDRLYVEGSVEEVVNQFPLRLKESILKEFKEHQESRIKSFAEDLGKKEITFVVLEFDGAIVGFGEGIIEESYGGRMGLIDKVYLDSNFQRKGFGSKIASYLIEEMKKQKIDFIEWRCYASNVGSVKLAEKLGLECFSMRFRKNISK